jgi:hypothetical protein
MAKMSTTGYPPSVNSRATISSRYPSARELSGCDGITPPFGVSRDGRWLGHIHTVAVFDRQRQGGKSL